MNTSYGALIKIIASANASISCGCTETTTSHQAKEYSATMTVTSL